MKEADIRPADLLAKYLALSLQDGAAMDRTAFVRVTCPACLGERTAPKLEKNGFAFLQCLDCGSVFCSPRPTQEALNRFYEEGVSSEFWARVFFPAVAESRREKLFAKKAREIGKLIPPRAEDGGLAICDVGAGYGIFLEELGKVFPRASLHAIEPGPDLAAACRAKGIETLQAYAEEAEAWAGRFDLVISSEVVEHVFSPERFVQALFHLTRPRGAALLTGLGYEGFDILVLQERSKSVFPPHHINFLSVQGFESLFRRVGFGRVDVWTPGELDVERVLGSGHAPEFLEVMSRRPDALQQFQEFLRGVKLSSHVWVLARKPTT